eukprot:CFRG8350T1
MTEEIVKFQNTDGKWLSGSLFVNPTNSIQTIILCHGLFATKDDSTVTLMFEQLKKKYSVLRFDFAGGTEVFLYAMRYPMETPLLVNVSGRFNCSQEPIDRFTADQREDLRSEGVTKVRVNGREFIVTQVDIDAKKGLDISGIKAIENRVLTIHGSEDSVIDVNDARIIDTLVPKHTLHIVQGADHTYSTPVMANELNDVLLKWIEKNN